MGQDEEAPTADSLDKEMHEQLHAATLKAADYCFELKKLCATVLVPIGTLVSIFTNKRLDGAVFIAGLAVIAAFWLADSVGYYYQRKLRDVMETIWKRRVDRCKGEFPYTVSRYRVTWLRAAFNFSMVYYLILAAIVTSALALHHAGAFSGFTDGSA